MSFPVALVEEAVRPEHVALFVDDDGVHHLLAYVGQTETGTFLLAMHLLIGPEHGALFGGEASEPAPEQHEHPGPRVVPEHVYDVLAAQQPRY